MKFDFKRMQEKNLFLCDAGHKPTNDIELVELLKKMAWFLEKAQAGRKENTLGESWTADGLKEIIDCIK